MTALTVTGRSGWERQDWGAILAGQLPEIYQKHRPCAVRRGVVRQLSLDRPSARSGCRASRDGTGRHRKLIPGSQPKSQPDPVHCAVPAATPYTQVKRRFLGLDFCFPPLMRKGYPFRIEEASRKSGLNRLPKRISPIVPASESNGWVSRPARRTCSPRSCRARRV